MTQTLSFIHRLLLSLPLFARAPKASPLASVTIQSMRTWPDRWHCQGPGRWSDGDAVVDIGRLEFVTASGFPMSMTTADAAVFRPVIAEVAARAATRPPAVAAPRVFGTEPPPASSSSPTPAPQEKPSPLLGYTYVPTRGSAAPRVITGLFDHEGRPHVRYRPLGTSDHKSMLTTSFWKWAEKHQATAQWDHG